MYRVINRFKDKEDNNRLYDVGDEYPKGTYKPTKKRIAELSKIHPKYKRAFIKEIKVEPKDEEKKPSSKK